MLCIGYGREAAARRMRGLSPRREPLIRLAFGKAPSPTRGEGRSERLAIIPNGKHHMDIKVRDSNGAQLAEGDSVTLIKDLKLKGSSTVLKRGTVIKNIHLTDNEDEIEGRTDKVKGLVLRTEFLKMA
jgi:protein PhnA